ncbi:MAG: NUDIX domain-containing protein [Nanoarchaeota archaeon]|nr:NUDIX domain-containing protein [Nanoarchaeota archaeon]
MKNKLRKGVFFVLYSVEKGHPKYLILKRKLHWIGWEFPKAGVEKLETKRNAVKRESFEETGLIPSKIKKHDFKGGYLYNKILKDRPGLKGQTFTLYSAQVKTGKVKVDSIEHSGFKWMSYKDSLKNLTYQNQKESLKIVNSWLVEKLK